MKNVNTFDAPYNPIKFYKRYAHKNNNLFSVGSAKVATQDFRWCPCEQD